MTRDKTHKDENLNVLSLEDSDRDFELIKEQLIDAGYQLSIERVETEDAFTASLRDKIWDLILADFKLPGFDAFGALRIRNEIRPDTPFICVSGSIGEETAIELLKSGATDYVIKDRPERLPFSVERALDEAREKKIRQQNDEALQEAYRRLKASQGATLSILEDLKTEVRARQAREAELQKVTMAVEQAGEVVMITDPDGTIQYVNPTFTAVTGYSREEAVGQNPRLLKSGRQDRAFYQELWVTITDGRIWKGRLVNKRKDGTLYTEEATISPVRDGSGRIINFVAVKRDITEAQRMEEKLLAALENLRKTTGGIIQIISATVEARDPYTAGHQHRVADLARAIAREMGLTNGQQDALRMAGTIHDLGKISVPADILSKPIKLTEIEFMLIQTHSQVGYDILKGIEFPWPLADMVLQHHERMNGSGYPQGLKGEAISLEARVLMVADVVEAMASHRPYRPAIGQDKAMAEIEMNRGVLYDPAVVDACLRLFREEGYQFER